MYCVKRVKIGAVMPVSFSTLMFSLNKWKKGSKYIDHINTSLLYITFSLKGKCCFNGMLPVKIYNWNTCLLYHISFMLLPKWPDSPMRTMLLISDFSVFHYSCWKEIDFMIMLSCFKSSHFCCAIFLVLCSFSERGYYLYCGSLPQTWIYKGSEMRMERRKWGEGVKDAREGTVQNGKDGSWGCFSAYHHFYQNIIGKKKRYSIYICSQFY